MNEISINIKIPANDEIEVTTIGAGPGAGESIILHLGNGKWAVIDSCVADGITLPLYYLKKLGVNIEKEVELVICTHWHTDHIKGLSDVLSECYNANFYIAKVGQIKTFFRYVVSRTTGEDYTKQGVWSEFKKCIDILSERQQQPKYAGIDREIYNDPKLNIHIKAVSPSDRMLDKFDELLLTAKENEATIDIDPNMCSIALILSVGNQNIILGADLECNRYNDNLTQCEGKCKERKDFGWCNVLEESTSFNAINEYNYIKIPHHSSITGFCPKKWNDYFADYKIGTSTVYVNNTGKNLPDKEMLERYFNLCDEYYLTAPKAVTSKDKKGKSEIDYKKGIVVTKVLVIPQNIGIICSRLKIGTNVSWHTHLSGTALQINSNFVKQYS